jgi:hypothetical protein
MHRGATGGKKMPRNASEWYKSNRDGKEYIDIKTETTSTTQNADQPEVQVHGANDTSYMKATMFPEKQNTCISFI